jgi:hypothetical protein
MPLVLAGILLTFQKKYIYGFLLTTIALGLELSANHYQMTYYLMLLVLVLGIVYLIDAYKKQELPHFFKTVGILLVAVIFSVALNATNIMATQEYVKESTRGKSELTINPDGSPKELSGGLDRDYITAYSYGITETFNLFIPRFMGGGSYEDVGENSETYEYFRNLGATPVQALNEVKQTPTYWGKQPIVEAPAYVGAVVIFLFVLALFLVKGRLKWWLVAGTVMSLLLSYGKNLGFLTNFFIDYFPLYNKFRAVSSIQVILELCLPVLAMFGLVRLFNDFENKEEKLKALKKTTIITGGLALVFFLFKSTLFDFVGNNDGRYIQAYGQGFIDAVKSDRVSLFTKDTLRTLVLVLLSAATIWYFLKQKLSEKKVIVVFAVLILFDLVTVDRRYVNNDDFRPALQVQKPYQASATDLEIRKDTTHYRVFDLTTNSTKPSYFHNSLNGYNAAEMRRYKSVFDFYISQNNLGVLNMLNTKYIIAQDKDGKTVSYTNTDANGNAWFVSKLEEKPNANEEIKALDSLNTKEKAVYSGFKGVPKSFVVDSLASIKVIEYRPNYIKYKSDNPNDGFAVFSENYYAQGWNAYIDGNKAPHIRVDYILRGMQIPAGNHTIEFKFEPQVIKTGSSIAMASSIILVLLLIGGLFFEFKKKK